MVISVHKIIKYNSLTSKLILIFLGMVRSLKLLIECGAFGWKAINPDIFGSMMQVVVHTEQRSNMGMHYTSVVNIMKIIEPLFLNDLKEELEKDWLYPHHQSVRMQNSSLLNLAPIFRISKNSRRSFEYCRVP